MAGFIAYLKLVCEDDTEMVKARMCSGAKRVFEEAKERYHPFDFCLRYCYESLKVEYVTSAEVVEGITGQLELFKEGE